MSYFEQTKITDNTGLAINPATDESVLLLRRVVKLLESNAVVDASMRQRIAVETAVISSGTITTVGTVTSVSNVAAMGGVDPRYSIIDAARLTYDNAIRSHLTFS